VFVATTSQFANQILGEFIYVFRHYIPSGRSVGRVAFIDIGKVLATVTQRPSAHWFGPAPQYWFVPTEEHAEKINIPPDLGSSLLMVASLKISYSRWRPTFYKLHQF